MGDGFEGFASLPLLFGFLGRGEPGGRGVLCAVGWFGIGAAHEGPGGLQGTDRVAFLRHIGHATHGVCQHGVCDALDVAK